MPVCTFCNEGRVHYDALRFFDWGSEQAQYNAVSAQAVGALGAGQWNSTVRSEQAEIRISPDSSSLFEARWLRQSVALETSYPWGPVTGSAGLKAGTPQIFEAHAALAWRGTRLAYSQGSLAPLDMAWHDPALPDSSGKVVARWRTRLSTLKLGQCVTLGSVRFDAQGALHWTQPTDLVHGHQLRDSTLAATFSLKTSSTIGAWRYQGDWSSASAFVQVEGLRSAQNDVKRFSFLRSGWDLLATRQSLQKGPWTFQALGAWTRLRLHPTDNWRSGESLAANRLYPSNFTNLLAQALYRRSYQAEGRAVLWIPGTSADWAPPMRPSYWNPRLGMRILAPTLRTRFAIQESTSSLMYSSTRSYTWQGSATLLLGQIHAGLAWPLGRNACINVQVGQWLPLAWKSSLALRSYPDSERTGPEDTTPRDWNLLQDGFSLQIALLGAF